MYMLRQHERSHSTLPLEIVVRSGDLRAGTLASSLDLSKGGLKVQTRHSLVPRQNVEVFLQGVSKPYARCRVVWAHPCGSGRPAEAGLQIVGNSPATENPGDSLLDELRRVYRIPAWARRLSRGIEIDFLSRPA